MTTIAFRDGVMAADTMAHSSEKLCRSKKLFRVSNGEVIGFSGVWIDGKLFVDWYDKGADRDEPPPWRTQGDEKVNFNALVLTADGIYEWSYELVADRVLDDFWAIGTGSSAALAAMRCGRNAQEAIYIAMQIDPYTGGEVETMELAK